jgi:hypothetical protein
MHAFTKLSIISFELVLSFMVIVNGQDLLSIYWPKSSPVCRMYTETCDIQLAILNSISVDDLLLNSSNENVFRFKSIAFVANLSSLEEVPVQKAYSTYLIKLVPILVGRAFINVTSNLTNESLSSYQVTVIGPDRPIDRVFNIWIWVNVGFLSLLMGILFNKEQFVKMATIPKDIWLSFCIQFYLMPMVCEK